MSKMAKGGVRPLYAMACLFLISGAHSCYPGAFLDGNGTCIPCPRGMYSVQGGARVCFSCPRGSFALNEGASQCELSGMGAYVPTTGQSQITACSPGTFQYMAGSSTCLACSPGYFQPLPAATVCEECAPGFWQARSGGSVCHGCTPGTYTSSVGNTGCSGCGKGHYQPTPNATVCSVCEQGSFQGGHAATSCRLCQSGTHASSEGVFRCTPCLAGHFCGLDGATSCRTCSKGYFQARAGASSCHACAEGTYGPTNGLTSADGCRACSAGRYSSGQGMTANADCTLCPSGTVSAVLGATGEAACQPCPVGSMSSEDRAHCLACPYGTICPSGSPTPILCRDEQLICNGSHISALPGFLPVFMDGCTGVIECPRGTQCYARQAGDQGVFHGWVEQPSTNFVIITGDGGRERTELSCPSARTLVYTTIRMDPGDRPTGKALFTLLPFACPAGSFLDGSTCTPCPNGSFSTTTGAFQPSTCRSCPMGRFASAPGSTACAGCQPGTYQTGLGAHECTQCQKGAFQGHSVATECSLCRAGTFSSASASSVCVQCKAGWAQLADGATGCNQCNTSQYSSTGDSACSTCSQTVDHLEGCPALQHLPPQLDGIWLTVRGETGDECAGMEGSVLVRDRSALRLPVQPLMTRDVRCAHTLNFMGRPDLSRTWTTRQPLWRRPHTLRVLPFGQTVHTELCQHEGVGVAFVAQDDQGGYETDITGVEGMLRFTDPGTQALLFWTQCDQLPTPASVSGRIPWGYCHTHRFCPTSDVTAHVILSWAGGNSVEGVALLKPRAPTPCPPSTSWLGLVELEHPGIPRFQGDLVTVLLGVQAPPSGLAAFTLEMKIFRGYSYQGFESHYAIHHTFNKDSTTVSVEGDATKGVWNGSLGRLYLRVEQGVAGVRELVQVVPHGFRLTLVDGVNYNMLVRTQGYTCRRDGHLDMLLEAEHVAGLVATPSLPRIILWQGVQAGGLAAPIRMEAIGVRNRLGSVKPAPDIQCSTNTRHQLLVDSCDRILARGEGGGEDGTVQVWVLTASTSVRIPVLVPANVTVAVIAGLDGLSGRFKVFTRIKHGAVDLFGVDLDATPFLGKIPSSGVAVNGEEWRCPPMMETDGPVSFAVGAPVLFKGTCHYTPSPPLPDFLPFLFTGGRTGVNGFSFGPSLLHPASPQGTLLYLSRRRGLLSPAHQPEAGIDPAEHGGRLTVDEFGMLSLQNQGLSPRCVKTHGGTLIPVLPASPRSLVVTLSSPVLVTQHDMWGFLPVETNVLDAQILLGDGTQMEVTAITDLLLETHGDLDIHPGVVRSRSTSGNFTVTFSVLWAPCLRKQVVVQVYPYSMKSSALVCLACPSVLALRDDPLAALYDARLPVSIPESAFSVVYTLVDGTRTQRSTDVLVKGGLVSEGGVIFGVSPGMGEVYTAAARDAWRIQVIDRWGQSCEILCNEMPCAKARLTVPGDGASAAPFSYLTQLAISLDISLFNGTRLSTPLLDGMYLRVNGSLVSRRQAWIPVLPGMLDVTVGFRSDFRLDQVSSGSIQVARLESLAVSGPSTLYQIHCSRIWEMGRFTVEGVLSDGTRAPLMDTSTTTDGEIIRKTSFPGSFSAIRSGQGWMQAAWHRISTTVEILATESSKYFTAVAPPSLPDTWTSRVDQAWPLTPQLTPAFEVQHPDILLARAIRWISSVPGVVSFAHDYGSMNLLSDFYAPIHISCILRGCMASQPRVIKSHSMHVNLAPSLPGQIDLGAEQGVPLPLVEIGGLLSIPVYIFGDTRVQAYDIDILLDGVSFLPVDCTPGDLFQSQCSLDRSGCFHAEANFPSSQRTGRVLVAVVRGRVMLYTLSVVRVDVKRAVFAGVESVPKVYKFSIRLGKEHIHPHQPALNVVEVPVDTGQKRLLEYPGEDEPQALDACCSLTVAKQSDALSHFFPSTFPPPTVSLMPGNFTLDILDPRLQMQYDEQLLRFQGVWQVLEHGDWQAPLYGTVITLTYTHPGTLSTLQSQIEVRLAIPAKLIFAPESLELKRIHCSSTTFQTKPILGSVVLLGQIAPLPLLKGSVQQFSGTPLGVARIYAPPDGQHLHVRGVSPGVSQMQVKAHGISGTFTVRVLDESVLFSSFQLPVPLLLKGCLGETVDIPVSGQMQDDGVGAISIDGIVKARLLSAVGPVAFRKGGLSVILQGNTLWGDIGSHVRVHIPACQATPETTLYSPLQTRLKACVDGKQKADLEVTILGDHFRLTLVGQGVMAFFVQIQTDVTLSKCQTLLPSSYATDCVVTHPGQDGLMMAGTLAGGDRMDLALVQGNPSSLWGFVEVYSNISAVRWPITAGRLGGLQPADPVKALMPELPVVDTTLLARTPPGDNQDFMLQLMTRRQRLVEFRSYSNEMELSLMFRVLDRYLIPDEKDTRIEVVINDPTFPRIPNGTALEGGGQRILATHVEGGWYAVQWEGRVPALTLQIEYHVSTDSSLEARTYTSAPTVTGLPFRDCPRSAPYKASFLSTYSVVLISKEFSSQVIATLVCRVHVVAKRISISGYNETTGQARLSFALESFIRVRQVHEILMASGFFESMIQQISRSRRSMWRRQILTQRGVTGVHNIAYINYTGDGPVACPTGMYFTRNGTYEALPLHAEAGEDCYGMNCLPGYAATGAGDAQTCVPEVLPLDVVWICVIAILSVVVLAVSVMLCVKFARKNSKKEEIVQPPDVRMHGMAVIMDRSESQDPFIDAIPEHVWDRGSVVDLNRVELDDYSSMILDDPLTPVSFGEFRR